MTPAPTKLGYAVLIGIGLGALYALTAKAGTLDPTRAQWIPVSDVDTINNDVVAQWLPSDRVPGYGVPDYYDRKNRVWAFRDAPNHVIYAPAKGEVTVLPKEQLG